MFAVRNGHIHLGSWRTPIAGPNPFTPPLLSLSLHLSVSFHFANCLPFILLFGLLSFYTADGAMGAEHRGTQGLSPQGRLPVPVPPCSLCACPPESLSRPEGVDVSSVRWSRRCESLGGADLHLSRLRLAAPTLGGHSVSEKNPYLYFSGLCPPEAPCGSHGHPLTQLPPIYPTG